MYPLLAAADPTVIIYMIFVIIWVVARLSSQAKRQRRRLERQAGGTEGGETEPARMLLELVRRYRMPLLVLPKGHPGNKLLFLVECKGFEPSCDLFARAAWL